MVRQYHPFICPAQHWRCHKIIWYTQILSIQPSTFSTIAFIKILQFYCTLAPAISNHRYQQLLACEENFTLWCYWGLMFTSPCCFFLDSILLTSSRTKYCFFHFSSHRQRLPRLLRQYFSVDGLSTWILLKHGSQVWPVEVVNHEFRNGWIVSSNDDWQDVHPPAGKCGCLLSSNN